MAFRKVVGAAGGDITHRNMNAGLSESAAHFVESTVAAETDDKIKVFSIVDGEFCGIALVRCQHRRREISVFKEDTDDIRHIGKSLFAAGYRVDDEQ